MNRILHEQTLPFAILQKNTLINWGILGALILVFMLSATSSFATCYGNVNDGGEIGSDQTICSATSITLTNEDLPSGGYGDLEYLWLSNTTEPNVSGADSYFSTSPTYSTGNLTETTWFRRCSRRNGCSSWNYGESNWVKITVGNAEFEHVDGVDESDCDANDGKIITDPFINQGTELPYSVEYTYNGQVHTAGPYSVNQDNYITGLAPGLYSDITIIDANNCSSIWGNDITIAEYNTGCTPPTVINTCVLTDYSSRLLWLDYDNSGVKEYAVDNPFTVVEYSDGSALITGTATQLGTNDKTWQVNVKLINKRNWADWSALGRSYKPNNTINYEDHTTWSYYELDNNNSTFTGLGSLDGETLNITHNPSNYEYGFQIGLGANLKDGDEGLSGWFAFTGSYTGHGDFNGDFDCTATIGDWVFNDANGNGIQEAGESGIQGITVTLINTDDNSSQTTTTNQNGNYEFSEVTSGNYKLTFPETGSSNSITYNLTPANQGTDQYKDSDPIPTNNGSGDAMTEIFAVSAGDLIDTIDAGYYIGSTITGIAFIETDLDGLQNGTEVRLDGVTVMLIDNNENIISTTTTMNGGSYEFTNLAPGNYKVKFPKNTTDGSTNYSLTQSEIGSDDDVDSDAIPLNDGSGNAITQTVYIQNGGTIDNLDAGYYPLARIGDWVFYDANGNGIQEAGESGIEGISVILINTDDNSSDTTTTNQNGNYAFTEVTVGNYKVNFPETGSSNNLTYNLTLANQGTDQYKDSDPVRMNNGSGDAMTDTFAVSAGNVIDTIDAGYYISSTIAGIVFIETDVDGLQTGTEVRLDGVTVTLLDENENTISTTTTANGGSYEFTNLAPGNYKVKFPTDATDGSTGYTLTLSEIGLNDDIDSDAVPLNDGSGDAITQIVNVQNGVTIDNLDAGYYPFARIGDWVFNDANGNGIQEAGETGIPGISVILINTDDNSSETTTTNPNGNYKFTEVAVGNYQVKFPETLSSNGLDYRLTLANQGTDQYKDSDPVATNNGSGDAITDIFTVNAGDLIDTIDAGYFPLAEIGDKVFQDVNENGIQDAGDLPFTDVNITLLGNDIFGNTVNEATTPDANGIYEFTGVVPGTYELEFTSNQVTYIPTIKDCSGNAFDNDDSDISQNTGRTDAITVNAGDNNKTVYAGFILESSLPVELLNFEAQLINSNQVLLKWVTASEINNRHFVVERSVDGNEFRPIGVVEGHGTTTQIHDYSLQDLNPFYGANYYRLKQVDLNGDAEYSNIETVIVSGNDLPDVIVYPNPVIKTATLRVVTPFETDAQIEIVNQAGQIMKTLTISAGANSKQIDLSNYTAGVYFAYINYNGHRTLVYHIVKVDE